MPGWTKRQPKVSACADSKVVTRSTEGERVRRQQSCHALNRRRSALSDWLAPLSGWQQAADFRAQRLQTLGHVAASARLEQLAGDLQRGEDRRAAGLHD